MTSNLQIEANRRNAALSTGPATEAGKATSSRNALTHGLTTQSPVLPTESEQDFLAHRELYRQTYTSPLASWDTLAKVDELASIQWRLRRVPGYEAALLSLEMETILAELDIQDPSEINIDRFEVRHLQALAFKRLVEKRVLTNLYNLESRLTRRAAKLIDELMKGEAPRLPQQQQQAPRPQPEPIQKNEPISQSAAVAAPAKPAPYVHAEAKVGRNQPCPCGSGVKFKRCCGNPVAQAVAA